VNEENKIKIQEEESYTLLSFPEVDYFNYAFRLDDDPFLDHHIKNIKDFYHQQNLKKHHVIAGSDCEKSRLILTEHGYKHKATICKTLFLPADAEKIDINRGLKFINVNKECIAPFTDTYLKGFEASRRDVIDVSRNFNRLLDLQNVKLFLLQYKNSDVGIGVLYHQKDESLLAGGAIIPAFRNNGFHKSSLAFRTALSLQTNNCRNVVAWAYEDSISLKNMLKLKMTIQQRFNIYEYCY
jgi:hypothetical protein